MNRQAPNKPDAHFLPAIQQPAGDRTPARKRDVGRKFILAWAAIGVAAFYVAYGWAEAGPAMGLYLFALIQLSKTATWRKAFYSGLAIGLLIALGKLGFFWTIFSTGAIALWSVYAFWVGLFVALARSCQVRFGTPIGWVAIPFLWCGLEYFRSELYFLRFSWLTASFAFAQMPQAAPFSRLGIYGLSFLLMAIACLAAALWPKSRLRAMTVLMLGLGGVSFWGILSQPKTPGPHFSSLHITGVQMEFPTEKEVLMRLSDAIGKHPESELLVLSEYTFTEPIPEKVKAWCRENRRYLIVGGKEPASAKNFYNTAFVVSPAGEIEFRQIKCVPIQFFKDGLPAPSQNVWTSPWGKIGICICYDLSYRRVTDQLIRLGAQALIVPTMDVVDWGKRQHELHARVAPVRAAEYGLPIFRMASSGISQLVDRTGRVQESAPFAGEGALIAGGLEIAQAGHVPLDRWLAPLATGLTAFIVLLLCFDWFRHRTQTRCGGTARNGICP